MTEVWGLLAKNQDDPQTIDEAIAEAIANHEADASAHVDEGESLQSHKAAEIIDHVAGSIVGDKLSDSTFIIKDSFSSVDSWSVEAGQLFASGYQFNLRKGAADEDDAWAQIVLNVRRELLLEEANILFQAGVAHNGNESTNYGTIAMVEETNSGDCGYGFKVAYAGITPFKIVNNTYTYYDLYALDGRDFHFVRADLNVDTGNVLYYIDGTLVKTLAFSVPSESANTVIEVKEIGSTIYASHYMYLVDLLISGDY